MQPPHLFSDIRQPHFNAKPFSFVTHRKRIEWRQDVPRLKAWQRQIQTPATPVSSRAKHHSADHQPRFADEAWQVRGVADYATSAKQPEKDAASGEESLVIYKNKISQFLNQVRHKGGTVAGSVAVRNQGHALLSATSVA